MDSIKHIKELIEEIDLCMLILQGKKVLYYKENGMKWEYYADSLDERITKIERTNNVRGD